MSIQLPRASQQPTDSTKQIRTTTSGGFAGYPARAPGGYSSKHRAQLSNSLVLKTCHDWFYQSDCFEMVSWFGLGGVGGKCNKPKCYVDIWVCIKTPAANRHEPNQCKNYIKKPSFLY